MSSSTSILVTAYQAAACAIVRKRPSISYYELCDTLVEMGCFTGEASELANKAISAMRYVLHRTMCPCCDKEGSMFAQEWVNAETGLSRLGNGSTKYYCAACSATGVQYDVTGHVGGDA